MAYFTGQSAASIIDADELRDDYQWYHQHQLEQEQYLMDMKDNELTLWKNETDNPKAPAYKGKGLIAGAEKAVSLWHNTSKAGKPYLKIRDEDPYHGTKPISDNVPF